MRTATLTLVTLVAGLIQIGPPGRPVSGQPLASARSASTTPWTARAVAATHGSVPLVVVDARTEDARVDPSDGASADQFGRNVAVSGTTALVGAHVDADAGSNSGSAYVYERHHGGPNNWGEVQKLTASDAVAEDQFGISVGISGDTAVVGAFGNDDAGSLSGSAYIFERDLGGPNNWGEVRKLTASDAAANDQFGVSVAISGDTVVVGAFVDDGAAGSAYVFERDAVGPDSWGEVKKLVASDAVPNLQFGIRVSISGDIIAVGSLGGAGAVYVFERDLGGENNWGQVKKLVASDASTGDNFGYRVANSEDTVVAGAWSDHAGGLLYSGSAYIFERDFGGSDNWGQRVKLVASDAQENDQFGISVGISGDLVVVGAFADDDAGTDAGSAYVFERRSTAVNGWEERMKLLASDAEPNDWLGGAGGHADAVAVSDGVIFIGAPFSFFATPGQTKPPGSAYVFDLSSSALNFFVSDAFSGDRAPTFVR